MNTLSKIQFLMLGFLFLTMGALYLNSLLVLPALIFLALQLYLSKKDLKRDYPEDWVKYTIVFLVYEVVLLLFLYLFSTASLIGFGIGMIYNLLFAIVLLLLVTVAIKFFFTRRFCYGTVVFASKEWAGVTIKGDLFSKINEANYAVESSSNLKLRKGDRVKVRMDGTLLKKSPTKVVEIMK